MTGLSRYFQESTRRAVLTPLSVANTGSEQIGMAIANLGTVIDGIAQKDEQFWVQKELADIDGYSRDLWETSVNNAPDGANGFEKNYLDNLEQRYEKARGNAPSGRALRMLDGELLNHKNRQSAVANGFEVQEKYEYRKDSILKDADNFSQEIYRFPGVSAYEPTGGLLPPGLPAGAASDKASGYFTSGTVNPQTNANMPNNLSEWNSKYYSPRDFADGENMTDRSGAVMVSKKTVSALDWVTDQFGYGKLQINSGYRSSASNLIRASSGEDGPHTKAQSLDIQVRDMPQGEKDRLYSLFKAAGANAFGFGEGVMHVEWRKGTGNGRNGDFEWTYGSAGKYNSVPVVAGAGASSKQSAGNLTWNSPNQYPYIAMASMTSQSEAGTSDLGQASLAVVKEANGSTSYGGLGLNSNGVMTNLVKDFGADLGLTAKIGTPEFNQQWNEAVLSDPTAAINAQLKTHAKYIIQPAQSAIVKAGALDIANDPRVLAFASDMVVQYGPSIALTRMKAGKGATNAASFINAVSESAKRNLDNDFATALNNDPNIKKGLNNRIDQRARNSMAITTGQGAMATGNVPSWQGEIPNIQNLPNYQNRIARIDMMVDSLGGTPNQRRDLKDQLKASITKNWLIRVAEINPPAAMAALMSGKYDDDLAMADTGQIATSSERAYKAMENEIRNKQKELISNLKTEASTLLADEVASIAATGKSLGQLTESHLAVLSDKQKAEIPLAQFQNEITQEVTNAATSELPTILNDLVPSGAGFAEEQRKFDFASKLVQARLKAQANDPAGYVINSSEQLSQLWSAALANGEPSEIATAINAMRAQQERIGVSPENIRTIPQSAMVQNQEMLENAESSDDAFAKMMGMRGMFGEDFSNIINDMEKSGLTDGWSPVNDMVSDGQTLLAKSLSRVVFAKDYKEDVELGVNISKDGRIDVAKLIFDGRFRRTEIPNLLPSGKDDEFDMNINQTVGEYLGDSLSQSPEVFQAVREAALSIYATSASLGQPLDATRLETALKMATGGVLEHNASQEAGRFVAPRAGVTQAEFDNLLSNVTDDDLPMGFVGYSQSPEKLTAKMLRNELQFVSSGDGRYLLQYPGAGLVRNFNGLPYEIDFFEITKSKPELEAEGVGISAPRFDFNADPYSENGALSNFDSVTGLWKGDQ